MTEQVFVFVDTNVAMHFKRADQIDWATLTGSSTVTLVIAPVLITELEEQKVKNDSRKLRQRAAEQVRWLDTLLDHDQPHLLREGLFFISIDHEPLLDFPEHRLSLFVADDRLIASALEFAAEWPKTKTYIASGDIGLKNKLRSRHSLAHLSPSENDRLNEEADPIEKELQTLRRDNLAWKNRIPKLGLIHVERDQNESYVVGISDPLASLKPISKIKAEYPLVSTGSQDTLEIMRSIAGYNLIRTKADAERHNQATQEFYQSWENYLDLYADWKTRWQLGFNAKLAVANTGTVPATQLDIEIVFPNGIRPYNISRLPRPPEEPKPPPQWLHEFGGFGGNLLALDPSVYMPRLDRDGVARFKKGEGLVTSNASFLKHGHRCVIDDIWLSFSSEALAKTFQAEYVITSAENPDPVEDKILFKVQVKDER